MRNNTRARAFAASRATTSRLARADRHEGAASAACQMLERILRQHPRGWNARGAAAEDHIHAALDAMRDAAARATVEYERAWSRALSVRAWSVNRHNA